MKYDYFQCFLLCILLSLVLPELSGDEYPSFSLEGLGIHLDEEGSVDRSIKVPDNFISPELLLTFIGENLDAIVNGEKVDFQMPYLNGLWFIPFRVDRVGLVQNQLTLNINYRNYLLGTILEPFEFAWDLDEGLIVEIYGSALFEKELQ